jgi:glycosyltransferase involved in cell wall biosynthesis/protein-L-isoaspartate O-methyltransferase
MTSPVKPDSLGSSIAFYSHFLEKHLTDCAHGNPRTEAAIRHTLSWIPLSTQRILDVGCGIGWSSWEIKRHLPDAFILGVDLNPQSIVMACSLFESSDLTFSVRDITADEDMPMSPFDAIVMLDVYEHIPEHLRSRLHTVLSDLLAKDGRIILTCPSVQHQRYLRVRREGLQPVDEDVSEEDVARMAADLGGRLISFDYVNIWNPDDYFHAVIERGSGETHSHQPSGSDRSILEPQHVRAQRVIDRLGVRVMRDGLIVSDRGDSTICVVAPERNAYSETFVRSHIGRLPAKVIPLYGNNIPTLQDEHGPLVPPFTLRRHLRESMARRLRKLGWEDFQRAYVRQFLQNNGVDAVLAEYGPTGVVMMDVCREAGIPLIVHFHGFDAYSARTLETAGQRYPELFNVARAMVAVSHDMEQQLLSLGAPRTKVHYNPCGVDVASFQGAGPGLAAPLFIAVGRFVDKKSPSLILLAFEKVLRSVPEARLTMMGDGYLLESSKQLASALGLVAAVDFSGVVSPAQVAAAMQSARAFVQHSVRTSYGDSEGTPVAVLEACASGLPVVATRHAGISDVVIHGETGLLVNEGDVEGMAQHMIRLAREPDLAVKLGKAGRERVAREFSMEKSINNLWRIIEAAIGSQGAP